MTLGQYFAIEGNLAPAIGATLANYCAFPVFYVRSTEQLPEARIDVSITRTMIGSDQKLIADNKRYYSHYKVAFKIDVVTPRADIDNSAIFAEQIGWVRVAMSDFSDAIRGNLIGSSVINLEEVSTVISHEDGGDIASIEYVADIGLDPQYFPTS